MKDLIGLSFDELQDLLVADGEKPFRAKQVWHWLYHRGETDFDRMTTLAKDFREKLKSKYMVSRPQVIKALTSQDKTRKWLVSFEDGVVYVRMHGACQGCSYADADIKELVEVILQEEVPGVLEVRLVL